MLWLPIHRVCKQTPLEDAVSHEAMHRHWHGWNALAAIASQLTMMPAPFSCRAQTWGRHSEED